MNNGWNGGGLMQNDPRMWNIAQAIKYLHSKSRSDSTEPLYNDPRKHYVGRIEVPKKTLFSIIKKIITHK